MKKIHESEREAEHVRRLDLAKRAKSFSIFFSYFYFKYQASHERSFTQLMFSPSGADLVIKADGSCENEHALKPTQWGK